MKKNMSRIDGIIRILIAIGVAVLYYMGYISGTLAIILGAVAVIFVLTAFLNFCPIYAGLGIRTRPKSE